MTPLCPTFWIHSSFNNDSNNIDLYRVNSTWSSQMHLMYCILSMFTVFPPFQLTDFQTFLVLYILIWIPLHSCPEQQEFPQSQITGAMPNLAEEIEGWCADLPAQKSGALLTKIQTPLPWVSLLLSSITTKFCQGGWGGCSPRFRMGVYRWVLSGDPVPD